MKRIFISYRRNDSSGHAGRLFDGLKEHFGADRVFMDVSDLRPGHDFVAELERALAEADCVLALIGPGWFAAGGTPGQRRIDDPDDFVRREISDALENNVMVIPVLVQGATMVTADQLPDALRPLARRQAITLTDQRWDSDLRELVHSLSTEKAIGAAPRTNVASAMQSTRSRSTWIAAIAGLALAASAGGAWMAFKASGNRANVTETKQATEPRNTSAQGVPSGVPGVPVAAKTTAVQQRFAVAIPQVSEVRFRTNRAQVVFSILGILQEPRDNETQVLTFLVRMWNRGPADEAFGSDQFRLIAGDRVIAPADWLNSLTDAMEAKETRLRFVMPKSVSDPLLEVRVYADSTRIPISLSARSPIADDVSLDDFGQPKRARTVDAIKSLPAGLAAGQRMVLDKIEYQILEAVIERETVEKASLVLTIRCSVPRGSGSVGFGSSTIRLWLDGVPRAPVNSVIKAVGPGDSADARFIFELAQMPESLEVGFFNSSDSVKIVLALSSISKR